MRVIGTVKKEVSRIVLKENKQYGIINYDEDNCYPQRIMLLTNSSPTAKICDETYARFVLGSGFKDTKFYKAIINSDGQTTDKILGLVVKDLARFRGFALHCNVTASGTITEIFHVPFEHVRMASKTKKEETGFDYAIYPDWAVERGKKVKTEEIDWIHAYNLDKEEIIGQSDSVGGFNSYKGQLLYYSMDEGSYPLAACDAVLEMMFAEIQSDIKTTSNIENNFSAKAILVHKGKLEDEELEEFEEDVDQFIGPEGSDLIVVTVDKEEEIPELIPIPAMGKDAPYEQTDKKVINKIIRNYLIPKVLLSITDDGGGFFNQEQIRDATMYYNMITTKERIGLEETFRKMFAFFEGKPNKSGDFSIIPIEFKISKSEPPAGLVDIVRDQSIEPEIKRSMLIILFGVDPEDALLLAPDLPEEEVIEPPVIEEDEDEEAIVEGEDEDKK